MLNPSVEPTSRRRSAQASRKPEDNEQHNCNEFHSSKSNAFQAPCKSAAVDIEQAESNNGNAASEARNQRRSIGIKVCQT